MADDEREYVPASAQHVLSTKQHHRRPEHAAVRGLADRLARVAYRGIRPWWLRSGMVSFALLCARIAHNAYKVSQNELWPVVAAKLGFTQFQGSDIEPARSGPAGAQHFRNIYQRFLEGFDNLFLFSIFSLVQMQPRGDGGGQPDTASVGQQSATDHSMMSAGMPSTDPVPISVQWNNASGSSEMNLTVPPGRSNANQTNGLSAHAQFGQPHQNLRQAQPYPPQPQQPQPAHLITKPSVAVVNGQSPTAEEMRQVSQWLEAIRQIFMHNRSTFLWQWDAVCGLTSAC